MTPQRLPTYPAPHGSNAGRALELWIILQQTVHIYATSFTIKEMEKFDDLFNAYWAACTALGMDFERKTHPIDAMEKLDQLTTPPAMDIKGYTE